SCRRRSTRTEQPRAQSVAIMSGRRRTRSASSPPSGPAKLPSPRTRKTRPARALEPVRVFIQTASTIHIAQSPNAETVWPATRRRASRKESSLRTLCFLARPEDADVAADGAAAEDDGRRRRCGLVGRSLARERHLGREVTR